MEMYLAVVNQGEATGIFSTQEKAETWAMKRKPCQIKVYRYEVDGDVGRTIVQHMFVD